MRVRQVVLVAALVSAGCASQSESQNPGTGGRGGQSSGGSGGSNSAAGGTTGGSGGSGGSTSGTGGATTGTGGAGGSGTATGGTTATGGSGGASGSGGSGGSTTGTGGTGGSGGTTGAGDAAGGMPDMASTMPPMTGGKALLITGTIPIVGTDVKFEEALKARGLEVEIVQESAATPAHAAGKRVIMMSYGMKSTSFKAEAFTDVPVPIIVTEHLLLPRLKIAGPHGFTGKMTRLTFVSDHELQGGFPKGDVEVYSPSQEFFWGTPTSAGIRIAHLTGQPDRVAYFAYDKGAMMEGLAAPAKRVQFFHASHSPDPIDRNLYLNANGLKLLGATIDWCLK
jgi:hypothetical protein